MTTATSTPPSPPAAATSPAARNKPNSRFRWLISATRFVFDWVPITARGLLLLGIAWAGWYIGDKHRDVVLISASLVLAGWVAAAAVLVLLAGLWLRLRPERVPEEPLRLETDQPSATGYKPGWLSLLPVLQLDVAWSDPPGVEAAIRRRGLRLVEEVTPRRRGEFAAVRRIVRVTDLFGVAGVRVRRRWACPVHVLPGTGGVEAVPVPLNYQDGEGIAHPDGALKGDRVDQRRYTPGDPLKVVLWKAYARTGRLLVRTPERAIDEIDEVRVFLVASDDDGPRPSDEATAGAARAALESAALGRRFTFAADGDNRPADTVPDAIDRIVASGSAHGLGGEGLDRFLAEDPGAAAACLLFVPARPGRWLDLVEHTLRARPGNFQAVIGVDGVPPLSRPRGWTRLFLRSEAAPATMDELTQTCNRLQAAGVEVVVLDRASGRTLDYLA
jgi:uncharacterized protein (DUF58 family)